jgi:hypothetical protein
MVLQTMRCTYAAAPTVGVFYRQFDSADNAMAFVTNARQGVQWSINGTPQGADVSRSVRTRRTRVSSRLTRLPTPGLPYVFEIDSSSQATVDDALHSTIRLKILK